MKIRLSLFAILLFLAVDPAKSQNIDTLKTEISIDNIRKIGGINLFKGDLYLLLKANTKYENKITQASEFYDLKQKYPDWYIYRLDTANYQIKSKLDTSYLPLATPQGFCLKTNLVYYVARKNMALNNIQFLSTTSKKTIKFKTKSALPIDPSFTEVGYPFLSKNADTLYFSAFHNTGYGNLDIWFIYRTEKGWSDPINAGKGINTHYDEIAPFLSPDNDLYFASNRKKNQGFDIYKRYHLDDSAILLSKAVNTVSDELYYCPIDNERAYLVSDQKKSSQLFLVSTFRNAEENILAIKNDPGKNLKVSQSLSNNSAFELSAIKTKEIIIDERSLKKTFELAQTKITPEMNDSLIKMSLFLENNPGDKLLICGHASPDGPDYINMELSKKRADVAFNWLIENKNLNTERIFKLYGGEYVFQDTISARNFSMFTAMSMTLPPLIAAYKMAPNETSKSILDRFNVTRDMMDVIEYELKKYLPMNDSMILYLPVRDVYVTKKAEKVGTIAQKYNIPKKALINCMQLQSEDIAPRTIIYIPDLQTEDDENLNN